MINFNCSKCGHTISEKEKHISMIIRCPECSENVVIPDIDSSKNPEKTESTDGPPPRPERKFKGESIAAFAALYVFSLIIPTESPVIGILSSVLGVVAIIGVVISIYRAVKRTYRPPINTEGEDIQTPGLSLPNTSKQITTFRCISCHAEMTTWSDNEGLILRCNSCNTENIVPRFENLAGGHGT